ncbi:MAG: LPXTG cell wall anchor domain-containing protein [Lachnospiraceae bacterium]|nr:LPXTG cell wall anchor domain-containing protein [Lachnospiraceae bacterium]
MKKLLGVMLAGVMTIAMGIQALAAGPSVSNGASDTGRIFSPQGYDVTAEDFDMSDTWLTANYSQGLLELVNRMNNAGAGASVVDFMDGADLSEIQLFDTESQYLQSGADLVKDLHYLTQMMTLKFNDVTPTAENPVKVTFTVNNMTDDMDVYVLTYCEEHGWELLKVERSADNQVTAAFHSNVTFVTLVYLKNGAASEPTGTSPKTGDTSAASSMTVAALLLAAFGVFALKKSRG